MILRRHIRKIKCYMILASRTVLERLCQGLEFLKRRSATLSIDPHGRGSAEVKLPCETKAVVNPWELRGIANNTLIESLQIRDTRLGRERTPGLNPEQDLVAHQDVVERVEEALLVRALGCDGRFHCVGVRYRIRKMMHADLHRSRKIAT